MLWETITAGLLFRRSADASPVLPPNYSSSLPPWSGGSPDSRLFPCCPNTRIPSFPDMMETLYESLA